MRAREGKVETIYRRLAGLGASIQNVSQLTIANPAIMERIIGHHEQPDKQEWQMHQSRCIEHRRPAESRVAQLASHVTAQACANTTTEDHARIGVCFLAGWKPTNQKIVDRRVNESKKTTQKDLQHNERCGATQTNSPGREQRDERGRRHARKANPLATECIGEAARKGGHDAVEIERCSQDDALQLFVPIEFRLANLSNLKSLLALIAIEFKLIGVAFVR